MKEIIICSKPHGCCPTVKVEDEETVITNDDGQIMVMLKTEWDDFKAMIKAGEFD